MDTKKYLNGESSEGYKFFGSHRKDKSSYIFRVLAPNASKAYLLASFNNWTKIPMRKYPTGIFSISQKDVKNGDKYKYILEDKDHKTKEVLDPFSKKLTNDNSFSLIDDSVYKFKRNKSDSQNPLNIYQLKLDEFVVKNIDNYISNIKENNFNCVLFMNFLQKCDEKSNANINLFSINSNFKTLDYFKEIIDKLHNLEIKVSLDFDIFAFEDLISGLKEFDSSRLYDYSYDDILYNYYSSINYDITKNQVKSYILSAIEYWIKEFDIDYINFSRIENLIYWQADSSRGYNYNWIEFLKIINFKIHSLKAKSIVNSTGYLELEDLNLGFDIIHVNSMRKVLKLFQKNPKDRIFNSGPISSLINYDFSNKILGFNYLDDYIEDCTLAMKIFSNDKKYDQLKTLMTLLYTINSNKILYSGNEYGNLKQFVLGKTDKCMDDYNCYFKELTNLFINEDILNNKKSVTKKIDIEGKGLYCFSREYKNQKIIIIINISDKEYILKNSTDIDILLSSDIIDCKNLNEFQVNINPFSSIIFKYISKVKND